TAALQSQRTSLQVIELAERAACLTDESIQKVVKEYPPSPPLACREGCAWCCHKHVGTTSPEVFRIADYLQRHLTPQEFQTVRDRIIQRDEQRKGLREDRWSAARLLCSLLVDDRCSVYPVRPLTCRGFNSSDAASARTGSRSGKERRFRFTSLNIAWRHLCWTGFAPACRNPACPTICLNSPPLFASP